MGAPRTVFLLLLFLAIPANGPAAVERVPVDLELVLAIDVSGNVKRFVSGRRGLALPGLSFRG